MTERLTDRSQKVPGLCEIRQDKAGGTGSSIKHLASKLTASQERTEVGFSRGRRARGVT